MDASAILSAYQGIKAAKEILTTAFDAKVDVEAKTKIMEAQAQLGNIQDKLFELREALGALQDEKRELQAQLNSMKSWQARIEKYELIKTEGRAVVYKYISSADDMTPLHFICPSCVNKQELHMLQPLNNITGNYRCNGCGSEYPVEPRKSINVRIAG